MIGSPASIPSLCLWRKPTRRPGGWQPCPVSARSTPRRWWQRWAMVVPSRAAATWRLVPHQATTGGKPRLLGISKRGNRYLRKNLIHGARSVLPYLILRDTSLGRWLTELMTRAHKNTVVVALANKLARIAWAVLVHGR